MLGCAFAAVREAALRSLPLKWESTLTSPATFKHDQFIDAHNCGLTLIDGGHFYTENIVLDFLKAQLENSVSDVSFEIAESNKDIVSYL